MDELEPKVINGLIKDTVDGYTDQDKRQVRLKEQALHKLSLAYIAERWQEIIE